MYNRFVMLALLLIMAGLPAIRRRYSVGADARGYSADA